MKMYEERIEELRSQISWMEADLKALKEELEALIVEEASKTPEQKKQDAIDYFLHACIDSRKYEETGLNLSHEQILAVENILRKHWDKKAREKVVAFLKEIGKTE